MISKLSITILSSVLGGMGGALAMSSSQGILESDQPVSFRHVIAERIDVVEPDGTLRQVLYSRARDPGIIVKGKNFEHPTRAKSGMLFYNDEGSEVGGLIFHGKKRQDGTFTSGGSLTFDAYEQDQIVQILGTRTDGEQTSGLLVTDRPRKPMDFAKLDKIGTEQDTERRRA